MSLDVWSTRTATTSTARELAQFVLSGLAALVLLAVVGAFVLRDRGRAEAVRDAQNVAGLAGRGIVEPALEPGGLRVDPKALARLDSVVRSRVLTGRTVRVKVWDAGGRIVYSDEPRLRGLRYRLQADERAVPRRGAVEAEISDLTRPENRFASAWTPFPRQDEGPALRGLRRGDGGRVVRDVYRRPARDLNHPIGLGRAPQNP